MVTLSFIIVNYKTPTITIDCIQSINDNQWLKSISYEIIVVDNHSNDGSCDFIRERNLPHVQIVANDKNSGFGSANNIGVKRCKGTFVALLNSDTIAAGTDFSLLLKLMMENESIGVLSSKILNMDGSIQSLGYHFPSVLNDAKLGFLFWNFNFVKKIRFKQYQEKGLFKADWVSGCFMLVKREDYVAIGGFDETIFMYAEDIDLCYRIRAVAKQCYILDHTSIFHLHGASSQKKTPKLKALIQAKHSYYTVIRKHQLLGPIGILTLKMIYIVHSTALVLGKKIIRFFK